jgi:hypothetical protein
MVKNGLLDQLLRLLGRDPPYAIFVRSRIYDVLFHFDIQWQPQFLEREILQILLQDLKSTHQPQIQARALGFLQSFESVSIFFPYHFITHLHFFSL